MRKRRHESGANRGLAFAHEAIRGGTGKVYAGGCTLTDAAIAGVIRVQVEQVASVTLAGLESRQEEVLADDFTRQAKPSLSPLRRRTSIPPRSPKRRSAGF